MNVEIKNFDFQYWDEFVDLINNHWKKNHPIINKDLFEWQYTGFGPQKGIQNSKLLFVNGKIEGFRGVIPGIYQVGFNKQLQGGSFAVWLVTEEYRGKGLGFAMLEKVLDAKNVVTSLGSNKNTSVPIYKRNKFSYMSNLYRFVAPLYPDGYQELIFQKQNIEDIKSWVLSLKLPESLNPVNLSSELLSEIWKKSNQNVSFLGLFRNKDFWDWRYKKNVGFKYFIWGDEKTGVVIGRIEKVLKENADLKVFRIIEIIPSSSNVWEGQIDQAFCKLISSVFSWAKEKGCSAVDFQISNNRLSRNLLKVGLREQDINYGPPIQSLAGLFQPFVYKPTPINGTWLVKDDYGKVIEIYQENTYFVKSDNDMDRTNYWPVID